VHVTYILTHHDLLPNAKTARSGVEILGFLDLARFDRLDANPQPLYLATGEFNPDALHVGPEFSLVDLDELQANAASFFADSLTYDTTAYMGSFSCYCANS
jgi:hypothetical protein